MESINHLNDEEQQKILSKQLKRHSQEVFYKSSTL